MNIVVGPANDPLHVHRHEGNEEGVVLPISSSPTNEQRSAFERRGHQLNTVQGRCVCVGDPIDLEDGDVIRVGLPREHLFHKIHPLGSVVEDDARRDERKGKKKGNVMQVPFC